jgi:hypothetical protein
MHFQETSLFFSSFFHPPTRLGVWETSMPTWIGARIFPRGEVSFAKFLFLSSWFAKTVGGHSCFAKIR